VLVIESVILFEFDAMFLDAKDPVFNPRLMYVSVFRTVPLKK
jgi:hypothetical protein